MCWSETPTGVFDSTRAKEICDKIESALKQRDERIGKLREALIFYKERMEPWSLSPKTTD